MFSKQVFSEKFLLLFLPLFFLQYSHLRGQPSLGSFTVNPDVVTAGEFGSWTAVYTVEAGELEDGGMLSIEFPHSWHSLPWHFKMQKERSEKPPRRFSKDKPYNFEDPSALHYIDAKTTAKNVRLSVSVNDTGFTGEQERYSRIFHITVEQGTIMPGEQLTLNYNNSTAPGISETNTIQAKLDTDGDGEYDSSASAKVEVLSKDAQTAMIIAPSRVRVHRPVKFAVVTLDEYTNASHLYDGQFRFTSTDTTAELPSPYQFQPADSGYKTFIATFHNTGIHYIEGQDNQNLASIPIGSNPIEVVKKEPEYNIYWGDLHSHTELSHDGSGKQETAIRYARDVSRLDFYAPTDHSSSISHAEWKHTQNLIRKNHRPGEFVTMLAYEWSARAPYGHNNVFFHSDDAKLVAKPYGVVPDSYNLQELWSRIASERVFTVPHKPSGSVSWKFKHPLRTSVEIYSLWGNSEYFGAQNKYSDVDYFDGGPQKPGPWYVRDAWEMGQIIGNVAGSDDHRSHPGQIFGGLTGVIADELSRDAIHDAVHARHTYATTGHRLLLNFSINNHLMGEIIRIDKGEYPRIEVKAAAMDAIGLIQVMRWDGRIWTPVYEGSTDSKQIDVEFVDKDYSTSSLYYVRLIQEREYNNVYEKRGRYVMAWSSPIWVNLKGDPTQYEEPEE